MKKGVDLAYCNINVNYQAMKDSGILFAIIKLGQGLLAKDPMFETHRLGCEIVEVPWDLYWYCDYRYSGARNVARLVEKAEGNYGLRHVCQDLEFNDRFGPRPSGRKMLSFCLDFFAELESLTNIVGTLYTNRDVLNQMWAAAMQSEKNELARHDLWFGTDTQTPRPTHLPIRINQWDLDVKVPWCQGTLDFNDFIGSNEEFEAWLNGTPPPMTTIERLDRIENWIVSHGGW